MAAELYVEINQKPEFVLNLLDEIKNSRINASNRAKKFYIYPYAGFLIGFILLFFSFLSGFFLFLSSGFLILSLISFFVVRSKVNVKVDPIFFPGAYKIIDRLKEDTEKNIVGWLDLTSPIKKSNEYRATYRKRYYKREWLNLNMRVVDGSRLSLHLFSLYKVKKGYTYSKGNRARIKIKIERERYFLNIGKLRDMRDIMVYDYKTGIIGLKFPFEPQKSEYVLEILKRVYNSIERKEEG